MTEGLIDHIIEALIRDDIEVRNDIEPRDYYESKAVAAVKAYEEFMSRPHAKTHFVEGLVWL